MGLRDADTRLYPNARLAYRGSDAHPTRPLLLWAAQAWTILRIKGWERRRSSSTCRRDLVREYLATSGPMRLLRELVCWGRTYMGTGVDGGTGGGHST